MPSLGERLNLLRKRLIDLRCGPGAAILPQSVTRIHMDFASKMENGHLGSRRFWRQYLPRLKYYNPSIPMIVNRHSQQEARPIMTIYLRTESTQDTIPPQPPSSRANQSKAQPPGPHEKTVTIDMKDKHSSDILEHFIAETHAEIIQPTKEDIAELQELEDMKKKAAIDRARVRQLRAEKKKEEDMLKRARAAGGMAETEEA